VTDWDYIVVGAGSAGCAVASELSASGDHRVLLLEAGGHDRSLAIRLPTGEAFFDMQRFDWAYHCAPDPSRKDRTEHWTRGRVLGGTSSVNGMNYVRGSARDFDRWAALGNRGWDAESVMPLFADLERCDSSIEAANLRGRAGPLFVRQVKAAHPVVNAFVAAAQSAGHLFNADYNGRTQEGIGYAQVNQRGRRRWSAADAFLKPALRRKNLELALNALVHRLLIQGQRVAGVQYEHQGQLREARARHVILCAGAINTPQLLMLSGIGDATRLKEFGIRVVVDRPTVGQNLMEHPLVRLLYRVNRPTYNLTGGLLQKGAFLARYLLNGQGPLSCYFESLAFLKTIPQEPRPDVQLHVAAFGFDLILESGQWGIKVLPYPSITVLVNKSYPVSRGQVRLRSADPKSAPLIEPNLLASEEDVSTLVKGMEMVRRIVATPPLAGWIVEETKPGSVHETAAELSEFVRGQTEIAYHPSGTCRMGGDEDAVVTPNLQVRGIENLWIADASIMPDLISGNTNAVCMMIGMKLGRQLAARAKWCGCRGLRGG
jgi:choline dehydrogenase-like flavoprotein